MCARAAARESREFYDNEAYDDRRFFTSRQATKVSDAPGDVSRSASESEVRVPLQADDSVVVKRGENGQDEIIIRRPRSDERSAT